MCNSATFVIDCSLHVPRCLVPVLPGLGGTLLVAQLVEELRYKTEGRGFDSRWCHWNFSLT